MSTSVIAITFLIYLALVAGYSLYAQQAVRWEVVLLGFSIVGQYVLTELKLGPASVRVFILSPLFLVALVQLGSSPSIKFNSAKISVWILFTVLFISLILVNEIVNGEAFATRTATAYAVDVISNRIVPIFFFVCMLAFARKPNELKFIVFILICMIGLSCITAILQYVGYQPVVQLKRVLHPLTTMRFDIQSRLGLVTLEKVAVSGLSSYSISFAYAVVCFCPLALAYAIVSTNGNPLFRLAGLGVFLLGCVAVYICQSRSGALAMAGCFVVTVLLAPISLKGLKIGKYAQAVIYIGVLVWVAFNVYDRLKPESFKYTDFERMNSLRDDRRIENALRAVDAIQKNPMIGVGMHEFEKEGPPPHNTVLNAGVAAGIPGVLLILFSYAISGWYALGVIRRRHLGESSWITLGSFLGLVNYTWNGMTHNDSIVSGGVTMFILLALMFAAHSFEMGDLRHLNQRQKTMRALRRQQRQQQIAQLANEQGIVG